MLSRFILIAIFAFTALIEGAALNIPGGSSLVARQRGQQGQGQQGQGQQGQGQQGQGQQGQGQEGQGQQGQGQQGQGQQGQGQQGQGQQGQGQQGQGQNGQAQNGQAQNGQGQGQGQAQGQGGQTCLNNDLIQSASALTGQEPGTEGIKDGQAPSATDPANFINFCQGQEITNGMQLSGGSCNGIPMGKIPAEANMITAVVTNPQVGVQIPADTTFNIDVQTQHLSAGFFTNPTTNYYTAPQDLDEKGDIIGHCHVTVQDIGDFKATTPPDPTTFAYFKGIDDAGNGQGLLTAVVQDGLPAGIYRVCTMIAARNHQPVNMPVAQRGAQDDCTKFEVVQAGGGNQPSPNAKNGNGKQNQDQEGVVKGKGSKGNGAGR